MCGVSNYFLFELFVECFHVLLFFISCIVMMAMGRNASTDYVFTVFINEIGWDNSPVAWFIGILPSTDASSFRIGTSLPVTPVTERRAGFGGAVHLSEEAPNSAHSILKSSCAPSRQRYLSFSLPVHFSSRHFWHRRRCQLFSRSPVG